MSRAFATCANKPKVSFEQSKSCKMKKNGKFSEQMWLKHESKALIIEVQCYV